MSFDHAPVSKGLMMTLGATSLLSSLFDIKPYFHLQLVPHLSRHHQYWRLLTHHLACTNSSLLLLLELIIYKAAIEIERQFGSVKFASFLTVSALASSTLSFVGLLAFHRLGLNYIPAGPISIIFSIVYQYYRLVPSAYIFQIFALRASNKSFLYLLALQCVITSQLPGSVAAAALGILTGQLYRADVFGLKAYRLPPSVQRFAARFLLPLIGSTRPPRQSNQAMPEDTSRRSENAEVVTTARPRPAPTSPGDESQEGTQTENAEPGGIRAAGASVVSQWMNELTGRGAAGGIRVPTEAEITQVASMFPDLPRESVVGALQRSPNIERAVETLLGSST